MNSCMKTRLGVAAILFMALASAMTAPAFARGGHGGFGGGGFHGGFYGGGFGYGYGYPYWDYPYYAYPYGYGYPGYYGPVPPYGAYSSGCYVQHRPVYSKRKPHHIIAYKNIRVCPVVR